MDARLLDYYNRELVYLRELGAEFAQAHPKVAGRLGMNATEVADPYVERLLEGFSFLTARIQMKMDAEFPRFSQRLLEVVYPNYLAPTPAMAIVQFSPSMNEGTLAKGFELPRGTLLRGRVPRGEQTPCEFTTGHAVRLWPLQVTQAEFTAAPQDLPLARLGLGGRAARVLSALRIRLQVGGGQRLEDLNLDQLVFHLSGQDLQMQRLLEVIMGHTVAVLGHDAARPVGWISRLPASAIRHEGFADDQALLPGDARVFQGYRLLQEYFAFAQRYLFFSINGLKTGLRSRTQASGPQGDTREFELTLLFSAAAPELEGAIEASNLALHCAPVINLFPKLADRVAVTPRTSEYHVVVDRSRPLDYEVFGVTRVTGHASAQRQEQEFRPFYGSLGSDPDDYGAYFSVRREPRLISDTAQRNGTRTGYTGSEVFVSLVDRQEAPFSGQLRHLTLETLCSNRDMAMLLPLGTETDMTLRVSAPVRAVKVLHGPTRPSPALAENAATWHLISHLGLNYLSLTDLDAEEGAQTLREMLHVYGSLADPALRKHISGLRHVSAVPVHHRLPVPGPIVHGRGVRISLQVDEAAFSGISPYLFGAVLEQFFARHVSINMMSELVLSTLQRGEVARYKPRMGRRPAV
ncbi:type VI secretion system baseplate subunit TssF [Achromobacter arsenitoxydans]|uniref:Type VI secretion system protein ImpG n=1 Tax=Achromobacter arsenitoxydans SY8 TaxID=477184 RepID=H0FG17_9BURK|nr:type VI secretion system baseplate subunit TssF [Achromobacter arsenitoxydans]EHK62810.1 type VI secretion system protein ImpG [Achromobacter arsenitoxydans SY8]